MSLRIRYQYPTGSALGYSVERLADGLYYDFLNGIFTATPTTQVQALPEDTGNFAGRYRATLTPTPQAQFANGDYCVTIHNTAATNLVVGELAATFYGGDDATPFVSIDGAGRVLLAAGGVDQVVVEAGFNLRQALAIVLAATAGKVAGANSATVTIRDVNDTTNRIIGTVDASGNRIAVTIVPPA